MFEFDWSSKALWSEEVVALTPQTSTFSDGVRSVMLLHWQEHCVECAVPQCYKLCPLYAARKDHKCARFVYGILRNDSFRGLLNSGADLRFRRWGKLETALTGRVLPAAWIRRMDALDRVMTPLINGTARLLSPVDPQRHLNTWWTRLREELINRIGTRAAQTDCFVVECYSFEPSPCRLVIELKRQSSPVYRQSLGLNFGHNHFSLHIPLPSPVENWNDYKLMVYPDEDRQIRLVFTWLDFVLTEPLASMNSPVEVGESVADASQPSAKVKCVAWDLDNTLWTGILAEDGQEGIRLRPEAAELLHQLDKRGILQTVVSKNNYQDAMAALQHFGLDDFFLYPAINWGRKSANLRQIADRLNIHIDTFALIDDSAFERREVMTALPMVRVYPENIAGELLRLPEFDSPITSASRLRRASYQTEIRREQALESFGSDYLEFLRSCRLKLQVLLPTGESERTRCLELIQRSNQLNLSGRRYNASEFDNLLADPSRLNVAMQCEDRFGDYGIVGFAGIDLAGDNPTVKDFVLSCRVAQKHVEHAFYSWLASRMKERGAEALLIELIKTARNAPLIKVFEDMPFRTISACGAEVTLSLDLRSDTIDEAVVSVDDSAMNAAHELIHASAQ